MGRQWGKLAYVRGQVFYTLSPYEQKLVKGTFSHAFPSFMRRLFEELPYIAPPFIIGYSIYAYTNHVAEQLKRKQPGQFENEKIAPAH
jgi:ubiquinol-cytochrome c reductase subunit 8